eukprot:scaffold686_cov437-Pavlova_lutheri.AAC.2
MGQNQTLHELTIQERERLVGMQPNDTAGYKITPVARRRMCGNAFPVGWLSVLVADWYHSWIRKLLGTRSDITMSGLVTAAPRHSPPSDNGSAVHLSGVPLLSRIRTATQNDQ